MKTVLVCGSRGLGDIVASTSYVLDRIKQDTHIIFHYPEDKGYKQKFEILMSEFHLPEMHTVTYEVREGWSTVSYKIAVEKFGKQKENDTWYFSSKIGYGKYRPFKSQWLANGEGPIGLVTSHKTQSGEPLTRSNYPLFERLWDSKTNDLLESLIDNKNYIQIGGGYDPLEIKNQIKKMQTCSRILGFDTGWAHIANCMRVPYVLCRNFMSRERVEKIYHGHPTLTVIDVEELFKYI